MPPDYKELPLPKMENEKNIDSGGEEIIKSLIVNQDNNASSEEIQNSSTNKFEKKILNKIKKN